uniref:GH3 domain-containing protein isoform X2 n=1 Tax=Myxine glutinosa TaxID=7769 RepID=UPI00358E6640
MTLLLAPALLLAMLAVLGAGLLLFGTICRRITVTGHLWTIIWTQSCLLIVRWLGWWERRRLERDTRDAQDIQSELLRHWLRRNPIAECECGPDEQNSKSNRALFRSTYPLTRVTDHQPPGTCCAVEAAEQGMKKPWKLLVSRRCSGQKGIAVSFDASLCTSRETCRRQKACRFSYTHSCPPTHSGIPIAPDVNPGFFNKLLSYGLSTPMAGQGLPAGPDACYIHLLFALSQRALVRLEAPGTAQLHNAFLLLRTRWQALVEDIDKGLICMALGLPAAVRRKLEDALTPDLKRADEIRHEVEEGFEGIARRLWPDLQMVIGKDAGPNDPHSDALRNCYCKGVALYSPIYTTGQGLIGINLWPRCPEASYVLVPRSLLFEFILEENAGDNEPETLSIEELEQGGCYELVVSSSAGIYRCRTGDICEVKKFYNQSPVVRLKYRLDQELSLRGERTSEAQLYQALRCAARHWRGSELVEYCGTESRLLGNAAGASDAHYVVFVELHGMQNLTEAHKNKLDQYLQEDSVTYRSLRNKGSVGAARVIVVYVGTFEALRDSVIGLSAPNTNPMSRHIMRGQDQVEFLLQRCIT